MSGADSLHAALLAFGLRPRSVSMQPGRWHYAPTESHPKKKNGRYRLDYDRKGRVFATILDKARPGETAVWRPEETLAIRPPDPVVLQKQRKEDQTRRRTASRAAREFYDGCAPLIGGHPYLEAKSLDMTGCRGLKVDDDGWLVVPMERRGQLVSVQRIAPDGRKLFWKDAPTSTTSYVIDRPDATLTVLTEGLATGLAIYAAVPLARVVTCFTAGNLPKVASTLPRRGYVVVAADNDHQTEQKIGRNPGLVSAREAAAVLGCGVAIPEGISGTDWADLLVERMEERRSRKLYGRQPESEASIRRSIDGEIATAMMRAARFLPAAS